MLKKICITISMMIFFVFSGCGASNEGADSTDVEISSEKSESIVPEYEPQLENVIEEEIEETFFVPDCSEDEVNTLGNSYANLSLACVYLTPIDEEERASYRTGRVTGQGDWIYWYENYMIKKMNNQGEVYDLAYVENASSLNVVGDWIYYLVDNRIECIRTDGNLQNIVLENVHGAFFINDNMLYYVTNEAVSATTFEYCIKKYNIDERCVVQSYAIERGEFCPVLIGINQGEIYYYYLDLFVAEDWNSGYFIYAITEDGLRLPHIHVNWQIGMRCDFLAFMLDESLVYIRYTYDTFDPTPISVLSFTTEESKKDDLPAYGPYMRIRNGYNGDLIISGAGKNSAFALYRVPETDVFELEAENWLIGREIIIEETSNIYEVYVVGDYIYYVIGRYADGPVYRVKMDGTDWRKL